MGIADALLADALLADVLMCCLLLAAAVFCCLQGILQVDYRWTPRTPRMKDAVRIVPCALPQCLPCIALQRVACPSRSKGSG
jgi:hypothetical protein